jgi:hypothetical protein
MGRRVTWLVVAAVTAIAVAAAVEALRGVDVREARPTPTTTEDRPAAAAAALPVPISGRESVRALLQAARADGVVYFGDRRCRLRTLDVPEVWWRPEPDRPVPCRFTADAAGTVHPDEVRIQPRSGLGAVCHESGVDVFDREGIGLMAVPGACAPAWRPDGSLTLVRDGELVLVSRLRERRVVLSRDDIARAVGEGTRLLEVAWLDDAVYAAAMRRGDEVVLAFFREAELLAPPALASSRIGDLRAGRGVVAARTGHGAGAITFVSRARGVLVSVDGGRAVSWSPDGTVAAVAGRSDVSFVAPAARRVERLALVVTDLEWLASD